MDIRLTDIRWHQKDFLKKKKKNSNLSIKIVRLFNKAIMYYVQYITILYQRLHTKLLGHTNIYVRNMLVNVYSIPLDTRRLVRRFLNKPWELTKPETRHCRLLSWHLLIIEMCRSVFEKKKTAVNYSYYLMNFIAITLLSIITVKILSVLLPSTTASHGLQCTIKW